MPLCSDFCSQAGLFGQQTRSGSVTNARPTRLRFNRSGASQHAAGHRTRRAAGERNRSGADLEIGTDKSGYCKAVSKGRVTRISQKPTAMADHPSAAITFPFSADRQQHAVAYPACAVAPEETDRGNQFGAHWDEASTVRRAGAQRVEPPPQFLTGKATRPPARRPVILGVIGNHPQQPPVLAAAPSAQICRRVALRLYVFPQPPKLR